MPQRTESGICWLLFVLSNGFIFWFSLKEPTDFTARFASWDKVFHFTSYGVFFIVTAFAFRFLKALRPASGLAAVYGLITGLATELLQTTVPARQPSFGDWLADAAGILASSLFCYTFRWRLPQGIF